MDEAHVWLKWLWRVGIVLSAALVSATTYVLLFLIDIIRWEHGTADTIDWSTVHWSNIALLLAAITFVGAVIPVVFMRWSWQKAFPRAEQSY